MNKKIFDKLEISDQWSRYFKQYAHGSTVIEQLIHWLSQVNEMIDEINKTSDILEGFERDYKKLINDFITNYNQQMKNFLSQFDEKLQETIKNEIDELKESGQLEILLVEGYERRLSGIYNVKAYKCDDGEYVQGDGIHDDTTGIQRALIESEGLLYLPAGTYNISDTLTITKNVNIKGASNRSTIIKGINLASDRDVIHVAFNENYNNTDVRNWFMESMQITTNNVGGRHAIFIDDTGMQMLQCRLNDLNLSGTITNGGKSLYIINNFAHGKIENCSLRNVYLNCLDANVIQKNLFFGEDFGITFDLISGVRNNIVKDNTMVNSDGIIRILNGDNIRIENNQFEQGGGRKPIAARNPFQVMIWLQGTERPIINTIISRNNFGGGTNLDRSIYIDNADKTVIDKNNMVAVNIAEIETTMKAKNTFINSDNHVVTQISNPRNNTLRNYKVIDNGVGTIGVTKKPITSNGWKGGTLLKTSDNTVISTTPLIGTNLFNNNTVLYLPEGFYPKINSLIMGYGENGITLLRHSINGQLVSYSNMQNSFLLAPFSVADDMLSNIKMKFYDDFHRENSVNIGTMRTGQVWSTVNNNLQIINNKLALNDKAISLQDTAFIDTLNADMNVFAEFSKIGSDYAKGNRLIARYLDESNYIYVASWVGGSNQYGIYKIVGGVETALWVGNSPSHVGASTLQPSGDIVRLAVKGDLYTLYVNDDKVTTLKITDNLTNTKAGVSIFQATARIGSFGVY